MGPMWAAQVGCPIGTQLMPLDKFIWVPRGVTHLGPRRLPTWDPSGAQVDMLAGVVMIS